MDNGFNNGYYANAPVPQYQPQYQPNQSPKNRTAALLLSIFVGTIGVNRMYLGIKGGVSRLVRYIVSLNLLGGAYFCLFLVMLIAEEMSYSYYYDDFAIVWMFVFLGIEILFAFISIGLLIPNIVGSIKDIVRTAKGQMTDGQGLPVTKW